MATILLHSSKTMRRPNHPATATDTPRLIEKATELANYLTALTPAQLSSTMHISEKLADDVHERFEAWHTSPTTPAIDAFIGDIYSGLRSHELTTDERHYAHEHLLILSGMYGGLRALDGIAPYRLEMGYKLPDEPFNNLYSFWGQSIAALVRPDELIINLSAVEYTKALLPHLPKHIVVITPKFLTISPKTGEPTFVTVHAKIARGAFAHWLITSRFNDGDTLTGFSDLGYSYHHTLSTPTEPIFVCQTFEGLGLSVRLS